MIKMVQELPFRSLPETLLAIDAVIIAGKAVLEIYNNGFSTQLKQDKEPLTDADLKSQEILLKALSSVGYPILSEESDDDKKRLNHNKIWIIDPLDGTSDFVDKTGEFSVMLALVEDSKPILGVIYQPLGDILFVAQKAQGAYKKEKGEWLQLHVDDIADLTRCKAVGSRHHLSVHEKQFIKQLNILDFSQKGSCGLKVAEICMTNAEFYFTTTNKIKHWDTCAAYCLISEAGGKITDMFGNDLKYNTDIINHENGLLVTNGKIHGQVIREYSKFLNSGQ